MNKCELCEGEGSEAGNCPGCGVRKLIPGKKTISEKDGVHKEWYERAKKMTLAELPAFLRNLTEEYQHDYGTICHAVAAGAVAAAWAVNNSPTGGITGFQSGAVMWDFIQAWQGVKGPARLTRYDDMLFPQNERTFCTIPAAVWKYLQDEAGKKIAADDGHAHPNVRGHWESIVHGRVPFGYIIQD
jgi:hypothetical protein